MSTVDRAISRRRLLSVASISALVAVSGGCTSSSSPNPIPSQPDQPWPATTTGPSTVELTAVQRRVTDELVSVFENSTTTPAYDYVEDINDGRGLTCGKIGFTTNSNEVRDIVAQYSAQVPDNPLARYLPRLTEIAASGSDDTSGLDRFAEDWAATAANPAFRTVQDGVADRIAYNPALAAARRLGLRTALGVAILYDTVVQHGLDNDPDGFPAIVTAAGRDASGNPSDGVEERRFLNAFLAVREQHLLHAADRSTRKGWANSVDRVVVLRKLVADSRQGLTPPVAVRVYGSAYTLT
jgi:chitosanase